MRAHSSWQARAYERLLVLRVNQTVTQSSRLSKAGGRRAPRAANAAMVRLRPLLVLLEAYALRGRSRYRRGPLGSHQIPRRRCAAAHPPPHSAAALHTARVRTLRRPCPADPIRAAAEPAGKGAAGQVLHHPEPEGAGENYKGGDQRGAGAGAQALQFCGLEGSENCVQAIRLAVLHCRH